MTLAKKKQKLINKTSVCVYLWPLSYITVNLSCAKYSIPIYTFYLHS